MANFNTITSSLIYFAAGLSFLLGLGQVLAKESNRVNYFAAINLFLNSFIFIEIAFIVDGVHLLHPWTSFFFITSIFLVGPLNRSYYTVIVYPEKPIKKLLQYHIILPVFSLIIEIVFQCLPADKKIKIITDLLTPDAYNFFKIVIIFGIFVLLINFSRLILELKPFWNKREVKSEARLIICFTLAVILSVVIIFFGFLSGSNLLIRIGGVLHLPISIFLFLAHARYPDFFHILVREIREEKYKKSMLLGIDSETLYYQLLAIMKEEHIYRDSEITLSKFSERLALTPHQLSEFLNKKLNSNFSSFINFYRINEAKELLIRDSDKTILSICFFTGFNSKSSFNTAFKKHVGQTPNEFRKFEQQKFN